jgi:uncharacterized protein
MRLSDFEITIIKTAIKKYDPHAKIYLFGSRTNDALRGGDIDILLFSDKINRDICRDIKVDILQQIGEQKLDLVLASEDNKVFIATVIDEAILL